jgi:hypothetical protein
MLMAVSIVNGFFCANSCDVSKAKKGEDPHPAIGNAEADKTQIAGRADPAVVFDGALSSLQAADPALAKAPANPTTSGSVVDLLA